MTAEPLEVPTLDEYWGNLESHLQPFSPEEQRVTVALYRELAKGKPVDAEQFGRALRVSSAETARCFNDPRSGVSSTRTTKGVCSASADLRRHRCIISSRWKVAACGLGAPETASSFQKSYGVRRVSIRPILKTERPYA